jgi:hypothetical protein
MGRGCLFKILETPLVYIKIKVFLPVRAQLGWLDNVSGVLSAHFSMLLIGPQCPDFSIGTGPCFQLAGRFYRRYANNKEKCPM